jgi:hypothetical protein
LLAFLYVARSACKRPSYNASPSASATGAWLICDRHLAAAMHRFSVRALSAYDYYATYGSCIARKPPQALSCKMKKLIDFGKKNAKKNSVPYSSIELYRQ